MMLSLIATLNLRTTTFYLSLAPLLISPSAWVAASFHDNLEQDPLPPMGPDSAEELHRKWDFEVLPC